MDQIRVFLKTASRPLLVVLGPTASGKTGYSIDLALSLGSEGRGAEIINADSRQLYRYLDIGTAKITPEEMRGVPHHLLACLDPKEEVTAAWYKREAVRVIGDILKRGRIPMLVGGSMLYLSAVIDNLEFVAESDPVPRKKLSAEYDLDQGTTLMKKLGELDPETALSIEPRNKVYLIRALEICLLQNDRASRAKKKSACPYDLFIVGITRPREELHRRISERLHHMFAAGWAEEVRHLLARGYTVNDPGLQSHGYREIAEAISNGQWIMGNGQCGSVKNALLQEIAAKTRQYAKRQMTWWRGDERIRWIESS